VVRINWKSTGHNKLSTAIIGRDNGAADIDVGRIFH
jgi:hypothetical protein